MQGHRVFTVPPGFRRAFSAGAVIVCAWLGSPASAQTAPGEFARVVVLKPRPDQAAAFAAGYERHLAWHGDHQDPWTWRGWTFVLGERIGQFMDGTFGHALANFDRAVDPAGDAADNAANVSPYADFVSHGVYERLPAASAGAALPDASPFIVLITYLVVPGQEAAFEAAVSRIAKDTSQRMSLFRLRVGGSVSQYLLMLPAPSFAGGAGLSPLRVPAGLVQQAQSELLRYQPQLSYLP